MKFDHHTHDKFLLKFLVLRASNSSSTRGSPWVISSVISFSKFNKPKISPFLTKSPFLKNILWKNLEICLNH